MCTVLEKKVIGINAKNAGMTVSEFLRELGLKTRLQIKVKTLPKEVLQLTGTLNHIAANINQLARKRNSGSDLNVLERALLNQLVRELQGLVAAVKAYCA
jgi:RNA polymerase-interacting CarD/CdnL/TRCF family regulator